VPRAHGRGEEPMDAVAIVLALAVFALLFGLIRAMDRI
jgi:hypothetical protein